MMREEKKSADRSSQRTHGAQSEQLDMLQAQLGQAMQMAEKLSRKNKELVQENTELNSEAEVIRRDFQENQ